MSVVFFTYAYPPARYPRSIQISRLVKYSRHPVRVITCADDSEQDATIASPAAGKPAELIRVPRRRLNWLSPQWWLNRLAVPDGYRDWALSAAREALGRRHVSADDTLVTFGDPMSDHVSGLRIKHATGARWIAHFSDPWTDNPYRRRLPLSDAYNRSLEKAVMGAADRLVFTSQETIELVMRKYPASWRDKARVVPHAFDPELYSGHPPGTGALLIRHVGNFYRPRTPYALLTALAKLQREQPDVIADIRVELIGSIHRAIDVSAYVAQLPPGMVSMIAPVDYRRSLQMMREADLLLVIDAPADTSVFLPSKLVDYVGAGRPIFAVSPPGAAAKLVTELGGHVASPADPDEIATKLADALRNARSHGAATWGEPRVRGEYSAARVAARFDALIDDVGT